MVAGTRDDAVALREEAAQVLARIGLRLSEEKTLITHIDEGLDFLGWHIQRHRKRGTNQYYVYTYPSRKALRAVMAKVKMLVQAGRYEPAAGHPAGTDQSGAGADGQRSSAPGCQARPSSTSAPMPGAGWLAGSGASIPGSRGGSSAAATATADGGPGARN